MSSQIWIRPADADAGTETNLEDGVRVLLDRARCRLSVVQAPKAVNETTLGRDFSFYPVRGQYKTRTGLLRGYVFTGSDWDKEYMKGYLRNLLQGHRILVMGPLEMRVFIDVPEPLEDDPTNKTNFAFAWQAEFQANPPFWTMTKRLVEMDPTPYPDMYAAYGLRAMVEADYVFNSASTITFNNMGTAPISPSISFAKVGVADGTVYYFVDGLGVRTPITFSGQGASLDGLSGVTILPGSNSLSVYSAAEGGSPVVMDIIDLGNCKLRFT